MNTQRHMFEAMKQYNRWQTRRALFLAALLAAFAAGLVYLASLP